MKLRITRRRIAPQLVALAGLAVLLPARARTSAAACPPAAVVEGSAEIAQPVSLILSQRGVGAGPSACGGPNVRAVLTRSAGTPTYTLHIVDRYGRASDRQVADSNDAASLIESWATEEDSDVLVPRNQPALPAISDAPAEAAPPAKKPWYVLAAGEISRASDDSTWYGGAATFCRTLGFACVGARARGARDQGQTSVTGVLHRSAADGSILAGTGLSRGRFTVAPIVALGARWTHSTLVAAPLTLSTDDIGFHAEAATTVAWAFARRWSVVAEVGGAAGLPLRGRGNARPPFFTLAGAIPADPIPHPPTADLHFALGLALAP
jgi:hypothetical protein